MVDYLLGERPLPSNRIPHAMPDSASWTQVQCGLSVPGWAACTRMHARSSSRALPARRQHALSPMPTPVAGLSWSQAALYVKQCGDPYALSFIGRLRNTEARGRAWVSVEGCAAAAGQHARQPAAAAVLVATATGGTSGALLYLPPQPTPAVRRQAAVLRAPRPDAGGRSWLAAPPAGTRRGGGQHPGLPRALRRHHAAAVWCARALPCRAVLGRARGRGCGSWCKLRALGAPLTTGRHPPCAARPATHLWLTCAAVALGHNATDEQRLGMVRALLASGADPNWRNPVSGLTAVHMAVYYAAGPGERRAAGQAGLLRVM